MPAEWEPHESTWLAWPHNEETWPGPRLAEVVFIYVRMLEALLPHEKVNLLVTGPREEEQVRALLLKDRIGMQNLIVRHAPTADAWIRDYGPTFVTKADQKAWCKWMFNAWGGKYAPLIGDTNVFSAKNHGFIPNPCFDAGFVLEGGSIEVNGQGTCLTTEQCLLNKNRNPQFSREVIEEKLRDYLGVSQVLWLEEGIAGDDTDGHIDDITRFTAPDTILSAWEEDEDDENYEILRRNWERLQNSADLKGRKWRLVKFPMPGAAADGDVRLPASYANFYIANNVVLLPVYGHKNDRRAADILKELFPKRVIVSIHCNALVYGLGAIHCITQQVPAAG